VPVTSAEFDPSHASQSPIAVIYRHYAALAATMPLDREAGLGGNLVFAGEITETSRSLLYASNIAGAASMAASSDAGVLRQAMRDGVVDFVVTSLEEALRILKNEIRKRQPVSVGVAMDAVELGRQMLERGVLPDLLPGDRIDDAQAETWLRQGARRIVSAAYPDGEFVIWTIRSEMARDFAQTMPKIDARALAIVPADDDVRRRWLRLAPRYLGRMAQRQRGVMLNEPEWTQLVQDAWTLMRSGETGSIVLEIGGDVVSLS
jgi:Urocanase Rossmann-like domain